MTPFLYVSQDAELNKVKQFLVEDDTNTYPYRLPTQDCRWFSRKLRTNARAQGIEINIVTLSNGSEGHMLCYFKSGGTFYFVEPQSDYIFNSKEELRELYPDIYHIAMRPIYLGLKVLPEGTK